MTPSSPVEEGSKPRTADEVMKADNPEPILREVEQIAKGRADGLQLDVDDNETGGRRGSGHGASDDSDAPASEMLILP